MLSNRIKFIIIILCFCYALFDKKSADKSFLSISYGCLRAALFFTVISDLFLLILDYYLYGVASFIIVQMFYGIKIDLEKRQYTPRQRLLLETVLLRVAFQTALTATICFSLFALGVSIDILLIITVFYFISIVINVIRALNTLFSAPPEYKNRLFAIGMLLFLLCDINVGFFNLSSYLSLPDQLQNLLYSASSILMWTFYAPAQIFLAISGRRMRNRQN
jgi:hypothetical protein